jgi:uncharacterized protein (TIGR02172 family)
MDAMNIKLDQPIAYGRTAEIYAWQDGQVLKFFYDWFGLEGVEHERQIAQAVHGSGLPVPSVGDIIRIEDRIGLTYQRVQGVPMAEVISFKPWTLVHYAQRLAELHIEMHAGTIETDLPAQRQRLTDKICHARALPDDLKSKTLALLETLPDGNRLCHGDFHPNNILVSGQEEMIIDWIDASLGNPLGDLARTSIILLGDVGADPTQNRFLRAAIRIFHTLYVRRYFSLRPDGKHEYARWLPIVAAARLSENIPELETWLIAQVEKGL